MLNGLFNIGQSALNASQAWISVTGNNLANVDTEGYSRQYVDQKDAGGLTYKPGAQPLGVNAQQIMRFFRPVPGTLLRQAVHQLVALGPAGHHHGFAGKHFQRIQPPGHQLLAEQLFSTPGRIWPCAPIPRPTAKA